jgi:hypothetical protein
LRENILFKAVGLIIFFIKSQSASRFLWQAFTQQLYVRMIDGALTLSGASTGFAHTDVQYL